MGPVAMGAQPPMAHTVKEERDGTPRGFQAAQASPRPVVVSHPDSPAHRPTHAHTFAPPRLHSRPLTPRLVTPTSQPPTLPLLTRLTPTFKAPA